MLGTGVPDDCRVYIGDRGIQLRDLMYQDLTVDGAEMPDYSPRRVEIRILPSRCFGIVYEVSAVYEAYDGRRHRHLFALPDTMFGTERGGVFVSDLLSGDVLLPDYATVQCVRQLYVQADFCRPVSKDPVYVDLGGMYVRTCRLNPPRNDRR